MRAVPIPGGVCRDPVRTHQRLLVVAVVWVVSLSGGCGGASGDGDDMVPAAVPSPALLTGSYTVYVTNEVSGDLTVIDPTSHTAVATLPLGKRPRGIRVSPDRSQLYVALSGSPRSPPGVDPSTLPPPDKTADGIGVVDVSTWALVDVLRGPSDPEQTAVSRDGTRLYIANEDLGTASVYDMSSRQSIAELEVGEEPEGVVISPDGRFVYVTSEEGNQVSVIDTTTNRLVTRFAVGARPRDAAFSPDGARAYVTAENGGTVSVVDTTMHTVVDTVVVPGEGARPMGIVVSPDGHRAYVTTGRGGTVVAIDLMSNQPVGSVTVGARPWGIGLSPDGTRLYTANGPSNDVSVVDAATMTLLTTIPAGDSPWGVAVVGR